jgi:hypothetical protein
MWCVVFFYISTHQPVPVPEVRNLTRDTAQSLASEPRSEIYGVSRPCR